MMDQQTLEYAAQELCRIRGQDPMESVRTVAEGESMAVTYVSRWRLAQREILAILMVETAIERAKAVRLAAETNAKNAEMEERFAEARKTFKEPWRG